MTHKGYENQIHGANIGRCSFISGICSMGTFFFGPGIKSWGAHPFREQGLCILPESSGRSISFLVEFRLDRIYSFKGSFGIHRSSLVLTTGFSQFSDNQPNKPAVMAGLFSRLPLPSIEPGEGAGGIVGGFHRYRIDRIAITFL